VSVFNRVGFPPPTSPPPTTVRDSFHNLDVRG